MARNAVPDDFAAFITSERFPCSGAKSALSLGQIVCLEAGSIECAADDAAIHAALARFGAQLTTDRVTMQSFACLFAPGRLLTSREFETALWRRLQGLHDIDAQRGTPWAETVSSDPASNHFSMSVAGNPYFIVGLHPGASRLARRFGRPVLVFNSHEQFEQLRADGRYNVIQQIVRKREVQNTGGVNPMLSGFGRGAEAAQYSGRRVGEEWLCPLDVKT